MPDNKWGWTYKHYPLWQFFWCLHCGERTELKRTGSGRISRGPRGKIRRDWEGRVLRDYHYEVVGQPHTCPDLEAENRRLTAQHEFMMASLNRLMTEELARG